MKSRKPVLCQVFIFYSNPHPLSLSLSHKNFRDAFPVFVKTFFLSFFLSFFLFIYLCIFFNCVFLFFIWLKCIFIFFFFPYNNKFSAGKLGPLGVVANDQDFNILISEFDFLFHNYIHFHTNALEKAMIPFSPSYKLNSTITLLLRGWLWHNNWYAIKQSNQSKYSLFSLSHFFYILPL